MSASFFLSVSNSNDFIVSFTGLTILIFTIPLIPSVSACTAIAFGRNTTVDTSTYSASTADCSNCDFRLAKVPAANYSPNAQRPVFLYHDSYPHIVHSSRSPTWHASNLEGSARQLASWNVTKPIGYIPQVNHTHALFEAGTGYALLNDHGVSLAESTCSGRFVAAPVSHGGNALVDISELSRIALERATSAREAINIMGHIAETYGYYGSNWNTDSCYDEAGESLMVTDPLQAWVFHIIPDDTGTSAVWVAKRIPSTDVAVVANRFSIRDVIPNDADNFLMSTSLFDVARRNKLWHEGQTLDFAKTFSGIKLPLHVSYSNSRVWRVLTLVNPDLVNTLDPFGNAWMDGYPFSVTTKKRLSRDDLLRIMRDHFEGSRFDLTKGPAGGPYGDPNRYDTNSNGNMSINRALQGEFGRPISMFRTSYTSLSRSSAALPRQVGPLLYFAQQQPSSSVFVPLYVSITKVPRIFTRGSLFRFSNESMFWHVTTVSNWVHMYYMYAVAYMRGVQWELEKYEVGDTDREAVRLMEEGKEEEAIEVMQKLGDRVAEASYTRYQSLFVELVARFHDGFILQDSEGKQADLRSMFYPEWWLESVGYFTSLEIVKDARNGVEKDVKEVRNVHRDENLGRVQRDVRFFLNGIVAGAIGSYLGYCVMHYVKVARPWAIPYNYGSI